MLSYMVRRLMAAAVVVWVVSMLTFAIFQIGPVVAGSSPAYLYTGRDASPGQVEAVERSLGLDRPVVEQYVTYVSGIVRGREFTDGIQTVECSAPCLGYSFRWNEPVTELIVQALPVTISLALGAAVIWLVVGIGLGVLAAVRRGTWLDHGARAFAVVGVSLPVFFTGMLLLSVFSYGPAWLRWFPDVHWVPFTDNPYLWATNLVLPWTALALLYVALYIRLTRSSVLDSLGEDFIRTARSKGLSRRRIVLRHALRPALVPLLVVLALDIGGLLGGAMLTETTFSLPGLGLLAYRAISAQDLPVIMGVTIVGAVFIVLANLVVDLIHGVVDPRVRVTR